MKTASSLLSAVLVHYRQPSLARACVATLRESLRRDGLAGEILVVDCASPDEDRAALDAPGLGADVRIDLPENRGYSGGVNAGLARARGDVLLLSNVDVEYRAGSLAPLVAALEDPKVGAAAPVCAWDESDRVLLPPGFDPTFLEELSLLRAGLSRSRDDRRFAAFARDAVRLWTGGGPARHVSGAVLAVPRSVFDTVGRFDEGFPFEYEETEWEHRVRRAGLRLEVAASARVRHRWGESARPGPETERRRRESRSRFRRMRFGRVGRAILERAERRVPPAASAPSLSSWDFPARPGAWLAISPHRSRVPFAGADLSRPFRLPSELEPVLARGEWSVTIFSASDGGPLETSLWRRESEASA
jgi:GT2 family glycosyltransferase